MPDDWHLATDTGVWQRQQPPCAGKAPCTCRARGADRHARVRRRGVAQRTEPRIAVAPTIVAEAASQTAVQIQAGPADAIPGNSFIRLRGLPPSVSLSDGYSIGPGSWAVPLLEPRRA